MRHERLLWASLLVVLVGATWWLQPLLAPGPAPLTMQQIDRAMRKSIAEKPLASPAARAANTVAPSVVRVTGLMSAGDDGSDEKEPGKFQRGVGTGVVIVDNGTILTNLHVVAGAKRIRVTFFDGPNRTPLVIGVRSPSTTSRCCRRSTIPDDLTAATMRSTGDLHPGDEVVAVGFPFGIGPSVSAGVVSGLKREFRSPEGQRMLDQPDPVRRRGQPRQFGRAAGDDGRRGGRHRHRHPQSDRSSASSSASASPCRSRTPPPRSACRRSEPEPRWTSSTDSVSARGLAP